jgi:hypothetical protein
MVGMVFADIDYFIVSLHRILYNYIEDFNKQNVILIKRYERVFN